MEEKEIIKGVEITYSTSKDFTIESINRFFSKLLKEKIENGILSVDEVIGLAENN